ncbi:MAG: hypothetical protein K0S32_3105 [Bacteroidetes bacterium]|jgi:hypothetical protein|nr:hypothetical protein [Bacteroidota bacterium]
MNWFLVKLIFSVDSEQPVLNAQFDEQLRLIKATNESDAYFKAKQLGKTLQTNFLSEKGEAIAWRFVDVNEVITLSDIKDGMEVYSSTYETSEKENFINSVLQKGIAIQSRNLVFC